MKKGWESTLLANVANCQIGLTYKPNDVVDEGGTIVLRSSNIQDSKISLDDIVRVNCNISPNKFVKDGDILMCSRNGSFRLVGKVAKIENLEEPMSYGAFMTIIRSDYNDFLFYFFQSQSFRKQIFIGQTATINQITTKMLNNTSVVIPPISQQQQIVNELDLLCTIIEKKKAQLNELDNLAQSLFYEMFGDPIANEKGWEVKKIGEIGSVERGAGISKKDFVDNGLPCIHYGQLHTIFGPTTFRNKTYIPADLLPKYKIAHPGDVIMAITSEDVEGSCKSTAWLGNFDVVVGSDAAIFHHSINGVYISYYTMTKAFYNEKAKYANGFKVTHISAKEIESIPIPLPPMDLQNQFAKSIEVIEHQKELIKQSIKEVETLFNSRMDYYFN